MHTAAPAPLRAVMYLITGLVTFVALDSLVKYWSRDLSVLVSVWFRYVFQALVMALAMAARGVRFHTPMPGRHLVRGALLLVVSVLGTLSVVMMPLGEFAALVMLTPLVVVLLSVLVLRERVNGLRWLLLLTGFAGAVLVLRPSALTLGWYVLMPLAVVMAYAGYQLLTNRMARTEDPMAMHCFTGLFGALAMTLVLPWIWQPVADPWVWGVFVLIGVLGTTGHFLLLLAFAAAPPSTLSVYLYVQIALSVLAGWLVFDHMPHPLAWIGIALIVGSGVLSAWHAGRRQRQTLAPARP
jgi:drug/metabolite transporter (DMT)-like permease